MRALRQRLLRRATDRGTTMTELLVVMVIMSIVVVTTVTLTIGFERTTHESIARQDQIDGARTAVDRLARQVRSAIKPNRLDPTCESCGDAFTQARRTSVAFYANIDNPQDAPVGPSRVSYEIKDVDGRRAVLVEKVQRPISPTPTPTGWQYCTNPESPSASAACRQSLTVRNLAAGVVTSGAPVFTYYGPDGAVLPQPGGAVGTPDLSKIMAVEVSLTVGSDGANAPKPTTVVQRILLTNSHALLAPTPEATP